MATTRTIDFRYAPPISWTSICYPDDPCKSLVSETGALLYGFDPLIFFSWHFKRVIEWSLISADKPTAVTQRTESARVPALIVPFAMSAFGVFLMRQFILAVPDDYLDAGRIDGANELRIYFQIVLPLIQPALVTLAIVVFVANWDEFLWMLVVTTGDALRTLPIGLAKFVEQYRTRYELMMAGSVIAATPVIILFVAMQRRFLQGMAGLSGIK
jgi:ABC-type Fe3+ transport system permease subunit